MTSRRATAAAVLSGVAILAGIAGLGLADLPSRDPAPHRLVNAHASPTRTVVACPPLPGNSGQTFSAARSLGDDVPHARLRSSTVTSLRPSGDGMASGRVDSASGALIEADPVGDSPAQALGLIVARGGGDTFGLAAAQCRSPQPITWFLGGDAGDGHTIEMTLVNPSTRAVTATIDAWGASGPAAWARSSILVEAGSSVSVPLSERIVGEERPAWRVSATGTGVVAFAQVSGLAGVSEDGYDSLPPASLESEQTIAIGSVGLDDATVRLLNPHGDEATYTIDIVTAHGTTPLPGGSQTLTAGSVADVSLAGSGKDALALRVRSSRTIAAAVRAQGPQVRIASDSADLGAALGVDTSVATRDIAWASASSAQTGGTVIVPTGVRAEIVGVAGDEASRVTVAASSTDPVTMNVAAGRAASHELGPGIYTVDATTPLTLGVRLYTDDGISWVPVSPAPADAVTARVDVRP
ncbi:hypothetical protein H8R18_01865 [Nanchangia anserum]|uniref:Secreted protein n=1 Tax=Nanchangia anserum TaxID=2692125 RepID=A0A8I0G8W4_9ACTO|nr:DUF5719 family protein [Nanchangia anserum]MBD3690075.1 hypothetical protein [Nanchangia anserum]QOX82133.1 hypothetical protein H8R18_01865 [Nanchangia anserum]